MSEHPQTYSAGLDREELIRVITLSVSSAFHETIETMGRRANVVFANHPDYPTYFDTRGRGSAILAIDTVRWFRDLPTLDELTVTVPAQDELRTVKLERRAVEQYYGISFDELAQDISRMKWRAQFLSRWDTSGNRAVFVSHFGRT